MLFIYQQLWIVHILKKDNRICINGGVHNSLVSENSAMFNQLQALFFLIPSNAQAVNQSISRRFYYTVHITVIVETWLDENDINLAWEKSTVHFWPFSQYSAQPVHAYYSTHFLEHMALVLIFECGSKSCWSCAHLWLAALMKQAPLSIWRIILCII